MAEDRPPPRPPARPRDEAPAPPAGHRPGAGGLEDYERPVMPFERPAEADGSRLSWAGVGLEFAILVGLGYFGGQALDAHLDSGPWGTAGVTLLGVALGTWMLIRRALRQERADEAERRRGGGRS